MPKPKKSESAFPVQFAPQRRDVAVDQIDPNPWNGHRAADDDLVASVQAQGVLQNLIVRPIGDRFQLLSGARRLDAALRAGIAEVPCLVREIDDHEARELTIIENLQREDLHPVDEARAIADLLADHDTAEVAAKIGKSPAFVTRRAKLAQIASPALEVLGEDLRRIPIRALELLATLPVPEQMELVENDGGYLTTEVVEDHIQSTREIIQGATLCVLADGRPALLEHKTTSDSLDSASDYWTRLRFNSQMLQYVDAARRAGWKIETVVYDVVRKPAISPLSAIPVLDEQGCKVVLDANGQRVFKKDGSPRETGDKEKGYTVQTRPETMEEFAQRLAADCRERPEFYFARREVPILDQDLAEFEAQRRALGISILNYRAAQRRVTRPEQAWPRCVSMMDCRLCEYAEFCLQNIPPTAAYVQKPPFEELESA